MAGGRGFTLVEVLVAVGLLVLISALALPVALTNSTGARASTAERMLTLAPNVARAEAQRLGRPVALLLLPSEDGQVLELAFVREPDAASDLPADVRADLEDVATWPSVGEPRQLPTGTGLWTGEPEELEALQEGVRAGARGGSPLEAAFTDRLVEAPPDEEPGEPAEPVVLAWFLSDGSALAGNAAAVRLADGRIVRLRVRELIGSLNLDFESPVETEDELGDLDREEMSDDEQAATDPVGAGGQSPSESAAEQGFEELDFEELGFEELGFEALGFGESGSRFGSDEPDEPGRPTRSSPRGSSSQDEAPDTNPQPPQPR